MTPEEKTLDRIKKVLALAARRDRNENEAQAAARRLYLLLAERTLPLRFIVAPGAEARVVPTEFLLHPNRSSLLQKVTAHRRNLFTEAHRLKDKHGQDAMEHGFFAFERHGYVVFIKLADVQVFF